MSFNLYSAGAGSKSVLALKRKLGYDQLLSQYTEWKAVLEWVDYLKNNPECTCKLFIDSGAYTAHTKGIDIDVDDYIRRVNEIDDYVTVFAQVDKIPGRWGKPKTSEELAEAPRLSWENYLYMVDKVKSKEKLLPIFHQGEDFSWLKNMLEYKYADGSPIAYIGISCNKELTTNQWIEWFNEVFKIIRDSSNPNVKTHAFGMTSLKVLEQFPFTSADSTSWVRSAGFGNIIIGGTAVYVSSRNPSDPGYIKNLNPALQEDIHKIADKYGYSLFEIADEATTEERNKHLETIKELITEYSDLFNALNVEADLNNTDGIYLVDIKSNLLTKMEENLLPIYKENPQTPLVGRYQEFKGKLPNASGEIRSLFNLCALNDWATNYTYRGTLEFKESLW